MARYIHPKIRDRAQDPEDSRIRLAIVPTEGEADVVSTNIVQTEATIERTLPSGVLIVETTPEDLSILFDVEGIESISPCSTMETLA